ncbi:MAG: hypothetical protein ACJA0V_004544 [Planctomycetota bacterium]|jgi:hypothetical protein
MHRRIQPRGHDIAAVVTAAKAASLLRVDIDLHELELSQRFKHCWIAERHAFHFSARTSPSRSEAQQHELLFSLAAASAASQDTA